MSTARPTLVKSWSITHPIVGTSEVYNLNGFDFEILRDENGRISTDPEWSDGSYLEATQRAQAFLDWAGWLEEQYRSENTEQE